MPILLKAMGRCTTDHITPGGAWLKYRGHLDNSRGCLFLGITNAFADQKGFGYDVFHDQENVPLHELANAYHQRGVHWAVIGGENYGEGSSREMASVLPRYMGAAVVIARSFARIHETNLKRQGILPLSFENPDDFERIGKADRISIPLAHQLNESHARISVTLHHPDGRTEPIRTWHTLTNQQVRWFKAGSALNMWA